MVAIAAIAVAAKAVGGKVLAKVAASTVAKTVAKEVAVNVATDVATKVVDKVIINGKEKEVESTVDQGKKDNASTTSFNA